MLNNEYLSGTTLKIYAHLKNESGTGISADSLTFYITEPGGIGYTYYYNIGSGSGNSQPVQSTDTVGIYYKEWTPSRIGSYKYSWKASGTINSTFKSFFEVKDYRWQMAFPGILTRGEFSTGLNTKSICVNDNYLIVEECNINQVQEHTLNNYIQGGPAYAIYNLGPKKYEGSISFPLRVDQDGNIESAAITLLQYAAKPMSALKIDTHHLLSMKTTTVLNPGTDNNKNLSLDSVVISSLTLSCSENNKVMVRIDVIGMVDEENESEFNFSTDYILGRALTWADCNASRKESSMRTTSSIEVRIENELVTPVFLMPYLSYPGAGVTESKDQIELIGVQSTKWSGNVAEVIRNGADLHTFIHGGLMHDSNLILKFGPITATFPNPVFKIGQTPLTSQIIRRTTEWAGINKPDASMNDNGLFTFV